MRLVRLVARGFRNLEPLDLVIPSEGVALLGPNGHGKSNVLEAVYYPVLFRSFRGAADGEIAAFSGPGFDVRSTYARGDTERELAVRFTPSPKRKRITSDGAEVERLTEAVGQWLAVAFVPNDVGLAGGPAAGRRLYLDRLLSLADGTYLQALARYRSALAQRNAALKRGAGTATVEAFSKPLAEAGATIVQGRLRWRDEAGDRFAEEYRNLEPGAEVCLAYRGRGELADVEAWMEALATVRGQDMARGITSVGPHRDDLVMTVNGRPLRTYGSTGQLRSAAIALKLVELDTLERAQAVRPALVLDDVFAELDRDRQERLADRLLGPASGQVFVAAPRRDELPPRLALPLWHIERGAIRQ